MEWVKGQEHPDSVHTLAMKIVLAKKDLRFRGSVESRRAGSFLILITDPPRGQPVRGGGMYRTRWMDWYNLSNNV